MKNIKLIVIFLIGLIFVGCKTPPVQKVLPKLNQSVSFAADEPTFRIYFPEFYDANGKVYGGDGIVMILPDGQVIIIDGFVAGAAPQYIEFIQSLNITKVDYLIATHYHGDHIGSFKDIINTFEIGKIFTNGAPISNNATIELNNIAEKKNITQIILKQGDHIDFSSEIYTDIFWPNLSEQDKYDAMYNPGKTAKKINNTSLVAKITYKDFTIIFPGDIYHSVERQLVSEYGDQLKATILKAAHHGEWYTANDFDFVKAVNPDYGIQQDNCYITARIDSIYRRAANAKVLYRLTPGYILIETNGKEYSISETSF